MNLSNPSTNPVNLSSPQTTSDYARFKRQLVDAQNDEELKKTADQLEGVFVSMLVKKMRESLDEPMFGEGPEAETYSGFFDQMLGEEISKGGGIGLSEMVMRNSLAAKKSLTLEEANLLAQKAADALKIGAPKAEISRDAMELNHE